EHLAGHASRIDVVINADNSITVSDDGRGIPTGMHEKLQKSALEVVMTVLHAGGKFDKNTYKVSGGLHGVGVSVVNALSTYLDAEIHLGGQIYRQRYELGIPVTEVTTHGATDKRGTIITFDPDPTIFESKIFKYDTLAHRLRELSFLNKGLTLSLTDKREKKEDGSFKGNVFYSEGGLAEFVRFLDESKTSLLEKPINVEGKEDNVE